jgi:hypothetical protein
VLPRPVYPTAVIHTYTLTYTGDIQDVYAFWVAYVFIGCYTLEMLLKLLGLGFRDSVLPVSRNHGRKINLKGPERIGSGRKNYYFTF